MYGHYITLKGVAEFLTTGFKEIILIIKMKRLINYLLIIKLQNFKNDSYLRIMSVPTEV